ncbi:MAG: Uma2 family endonuclease [Armatimonadota bacterium]|nr:Uma2 family endonuclease [Armatimonadota bacterium]MDR7520464.1 Uma2 family endonuclease [Armatimonadota bacterium]MDR7549211.1 Uma2 family endonuclease [Armatimonadota bacterium]
MGVRTKVWTREEYDRLVAAGAFPPGARVQLIHGEIVEMTPQSALHAAAVELAQNALHALGPEYGVRVQLPLALGAESEPEPDLAVVAGPPRSRAERHPATAVLVVEVADTTLEFDRTRKQAVYASARIPEDWVVNLVDRVLEVCREPEESTYRTTMRLAPGDSIAPLAAPTVRIAVSDLLP